MLPPKLTFVNFFCLFFEGFPYAVLAPISLLPSLFPNSIFLSPKSPKVHIGVGCPYRFFRVRVEVNNLYSSLKLEGFE